MNDWLGTVFLLGRLEKRLNKYHPFQSFYTVIFLSFLGSLTSLYDIRGCIPKKTANKTHVYSALIASISALQTEYIPIQTETEINEYLTNVQWSVMSIEQLYV